ncbi:MAG: Na+/H+ antiporter subunit E [Alphaproteobacteria bacterium]|jgi:multicomponent Na+:H+ antiporter subunit E|uniref:Na+/H+ antiporter subunit E n=1 Tax=Rhizobium/Agrobacterium group TaxID=227290 RepID=UPI00129AEDE4|nr:Na+/H+ antiporter subunit E [Agrobacterium sp. MA01]MBU0740669.1 Na+/H+ antiporter subunit E [Alphaproteobacteria bacterium]MDM7979101.1 Na+/H+ antiporter subunit E [Rhizobium sp.]MBU0834331.1 Na+/H+ antiporter subunit E [Alphaproteobacteria bacterium]MBU1765590.1 Na+/H+ antiporter subunit E [Alphaproteobacteria bacterium]MDM8015525.1 Na+/H+ antiporter subunit E [Rhizobium sp.]
MTLVKRIGRSMTLGLVFINELVRSSIAVARQVLGDSSQLKPAILAVPLDLRSRAGVTALANCVSLTPGTTSLHVSEDLSTLYVHVLDAPQPDAVVDSIKNTFETRIKEIEG